MSRSTKRDNIPPELAEEERWLPRIGEKHAPTGWNNPENWQALDDIPEDQEAIFNLCGTGFLVIDGDHIAPDGKLYQEAQDMLREILGGLPTYAEWSQSGHGVHLVYDLGEYRDEFQQMTGRGFYNIPLQSAADAHIEFYYSTPHLFRFTGRKMENSADRVTGGEAAAEAARRIQKLLEKHNGCQPAETRTTNGQALPDQIPEGQRHYFIVQRCGELVNRLGDRASTSAILAMVESDLFEFCENPGNVDLNEFRKKYRKTIERFQANRQQEQTDPSFYSYALKAWRNEHPGQIFDPAVTSWGEVREAGDRAKAAGWKPETRMQEPAAHRPQIKLLSVADIQRKEAEWMITGYIPKYQITTLAGDGGTGKTTIECNITAAVTTGKHSILTADLMPADFGSDAGTVLFLTGEDSFEYVLRERLEENGADLSRVLTVDIADPCFTDIKFNSDILKDLIKQCKPALVIFDPIQSFVPPDIQMGWRNAMRQCLSPLIGLGKEEGSTFLIICHTNKQKGCYGRKRIADSSDIWDISRSVLIAGDTGEGSIKYLSHEKCNYGQLQRTLLYDLDGQKPIYKGRTDLKDRDYMQQSVQAPAAPARDEAKELIVQTLEENDGKMAAKELDSAIKSMGISGGTLNRAKKELKRDKVIRYQREGFNPAVWFVSLMQSESE